MKVFPIIKILVLSLGLVLYLSSCGESGQSQQAETESANHHNHEAEEGHEHEHDGSNHEQAHTAHGEGPAYISTYVCPMHCEGSGSAEPGECPVCGMKYVAQSDHVKDGHDHKE